MQYLQSVPNHYQFSELSRDRIVVSTSRCGRDNPGSNPGHGIGTDYTCHGIAAILQSIKLKSLNFHDQI